MKTRASRQRGFAMMECLVYLGVFGVLIGLAFLGLYQCIDNMKGVRRNTDDIARTLHAGELWRRDVRMATSPIQIEEPDHIVRIPHQQGEVFYQFTEAQVLRKTGPDAPWIVLLPKVEHSQMEVDRRQHVTAWRWELELQPVKEPVRVKPLFTFFAVPGAVSPP